MASFSVQNIGPCEATLSVSGLSGGDALWYFVRLASDTSDVTDEKTATAASSTAAWTTYALAPSTSYTVNVRVNGTWIGAQTFTTPPVPSVSVSAVTDSSVTTLFSGLQSGATYSVMISPLGAGTGTALHFSFVAASSTATQTYSGLNADTDYEISISVYGTSTLGFAYFTTDPAVPVLPTPEFEITGITDTSVTAYLSNLTVGHEYEARVTLGVIQKASTTFTATSAAKTVTLTGLSPEITYNFYLYQDGVKIGTVAFTTDAAEPPPPEPVEYYAVLKFDPNGGTGGPSVITGYGVDTTLVSVTLPAEIPTRENYRFLYWLCEGAALYPGAAYTFTGTEQGTIYTLTAAWELTAVDRIGSGGQYKRCVVWIGNDGQWHKTTRWIGDGGVWKK